MQLLSDCSPQSVLHILELAKLTHCQGCRFYRAEGRGNMWDTHGSHIPKVHNVHGLGLIEFPYEAIS